MKRLFLFSILFIAFCSHSQFTVTYKAVDSIAFLFKFDSTEPIDSLEWNQSLDKLQQLSNKRLTLNAYTDSVGTLNYNQNLAQRRMERILELALPLLKNSVEIHPYNLNEARTNQTNVTDSLFRRVDFIVFEQIIDVEIGKPYALPIQFDGGLDVLRPEAKLILDEIANQLINLRQFRIELHGHVSSHHNDIDLSQRRTYSVRNYLISRGIDANRIKGIGFGNTRKIRFEERWENFEENRRVEILFFPIE